MAGIPCAPASEEYIFFNGKRVARRDLPSLAVHYYMSDHLGTHAVVMNAAGTGCEQDMDFYPYGGVQNDYCGTVTQNYKFTGKERDAESGLDNFGARYDESAMGRFMTPDWAAQATAVPYAMFGDPQSLNLYAYVRNNPLGSVDVDGHNAMSLAGIHGTACAVNAAGYCQLGEGPGIPEGQQSPEQQAQAQNTTAQQQNAAPLTDKNGNVVQGANGKPALIPDGFDVNGVIKTGQSDKELRGYAPIVGRAQTAEDLANFRRGGKWDLQRLSGSFDPRYIDSVTILIGMFAASAGITRSEILGIENAVAIGSRYAKGTPMDSTYTHLPARNVTNTDIGMQLVQSGAISVPQE